MEGSVYWRQKVPSPKPRNQPLLPPPRQQQQHQQQLQLGVAGLMFSSYGQQQQQQQQQQLQGLQLSGLQTGGGGGGQNQGAMGLSVMGPTPQFTYNGIPNVPLCEVVMGTLGNTFLSPVPLPSPVFSVTVVFNTTYLLNHLLLKPYPEEPPADRPHLGFSYTVEISQDGNNWMALFNYSSFFCYSTQSLVFPKQAIR